MECLECLSKNVTVDPSRAEVICDDCGFVSPQIDIQRETEFEEMDNGRIAAIGHIVSIGDRANKQNTINKASARIQNLCSKLGLTKALAAYSLEIYESALSLGMTRGRNALVTVGACVYLAARKKQQSLMLLDVSDKVGVNVYTLGKTFNELKEKTGQRVSDIDPCLFIDRFAIGMELGDKKSVVATTALKLLQRMKKDWISTGRRPTGITAAAMLIASRLHGFDRDCEDVARIAGISQHTARKRLQEWAQTPTSDLTLAEFGHVNLEEEFDPPAFINQKVDEQGALKLSDFDFENLRIEMHSLQKRLNDEGVEKKREKLDGTFYQRFVDSVQRGEVDMEALIGTFEDNEEGNEDTSLEIAGREELLTQCTGIRMAFMTLKKKESVEDDCEKESELPMYIAEYEETAADHDWFIEAAMAEEIDDEELERVYICGKEECLIKYKWWLKDNKKYYSDQKKATEKRKQKMQLELETSKKNNPKRQKRSHAHMLNPAEVLLDIKACLSTNSDSLPIKVQQTVAQDKDIEDNGFLAIKDGREDGAKEGDEEEEEEEEEDDDEYKNEMCHDETDASEDIQYDFNED